MLGFAAKATTKKNEVGEYFNSLGVKLEKASEELEEVAKKSETGGDKSDLLKHSIREAINSAKEVLDALKCHLKSLGQVGEIDKIKNAKIKTGNLDANVNNDAGELVTGGNVANGAKVATNADLVVAVALKAMTKSGKFSADNNDTGIVKAAAASAVNKVLGILDLIVRKTVSINLNKIREAVKGIQYFETVETDTTEAFTQTQLLNKQYKW
ncbi:variable large family protein [Borrelia duttonii]